MALFTDTVTIFQKQNNSYLKTVVEGCMWSDNISKSIQDGRLTTVKTNSITFIPPFQVDLSTYGYEDAIFYGNISETPSDIKGNRLSDLLKKYKSKCGIIREVNDNSNKDTLKNIKVIVY